MQLSVRQVCLRSVLVLLALSAYFLASYSRSLKYFVLLVSIPLIIRAPDPTLRVKSVGSWRPDLGLP